MEFFTGTESRYVCALLALILMWLVWRPPASARRRTLLYALLILVGVANALMLTHRRIAHSNLGHYYLGAKYPCSYFDFYSLVTAAREDPQINFRNLREPDRMIRADVREQRLYYLDLLDNAALPPPAATGTDALREHCTDNGLFAAESKALLESAFSPARAAALREDLNRVGLDIDDQGFNGSPFYALVRRLDPTLYRPFSGAVFWVNLAWQFAALCGIALLCRRALGWTVGNTVLAAALVLTSWDYIGWSLNGLVTAGWILPVAVALWGYSTRRPLVAGLAIAWGGLLKLFPFVLTMPLFVMLAQAVMRRRRSPDTAFALQTLGACAASTLMLALLASATGLSWAGFFEKIHIQFSRAHYTGNGVGLSHLLLSLGMPKCVGLLLSQLTALFCVGWMFWGNGNDTPGPILARRSLILLACTVWLSSKWLNYYSIVGVLLIPGLLRRKHSAAVLLLAASALSQALPEFSRLYPGFSAILSLVKVLPHLAIPATALVIEIYDTAQAIPRGPARASMTAWLRRYGATVAATAILATCTVLCAEVCLHHTVGSLVHSGTILLRQGRADEALAPLLRAQRLAPRNPAVHFHAALAQEARGETREAMNQYARALALDPHLTRVRANLGILQSRAGRLDEAITTLSACVRAVPHDESFRYNLGVALFSSGRTREAAEQFEAALHINPDFKPARIGLARCGGQTADLRP